MKARTIALILLVTAITVCAQTAPPSQKVAPAAPAATQAKPAAASPFAKAAPAQTAKPAAVKPAAPAPAKAAAAAVKPAKPAVSKTAKPADKPAVSKAAKPAPKPALSKAAKPAAKPAKPAAIKAKQPATLATAKTPKAKRDPFVSPIVRAEAGTVACSTGKKCLAIDSIVLKGIVKSQVGMIAVVESSARRLSYFLRENDPVFNGYVVKITRDSVVFRENVMDNLGRQSTREVIKKVVAPVV